MKKGDYIILLAENSKTAEHELLLQCMECYGVNSLRNLTEEQMKEFWSRCAHS
jgi:hypothetical protein